MKSGVVNQPLILQEAETSIEHTHCITHYKWVESELVEDAGG